jgi:hypothetical protein
MEMVQMGRTILEITPVVAGVGSALGLVTEATTKNNRHLSKLNIQVG